MTTATILNFSIGFILGIVIFNIVYYKISSYLDKKEQMKSQKWWDDPSTEEFKYDENGEKIWSNKKGCIGPATYIN